MKSIIAAVALVAISQVTLAGEGPKESSGTVIFNGTPSVPAQIGREGETKGGTIVYEGSPDYLKKSDYNTVYATAALAGANCAEGDVVLAYYNWNFQVAGYTCVQMAPVGNNVQ